MPALTSVLGNVLLESILECNVLTAVSIIKYITLKKTNHNKIMPRYRKAPVVEPHAALDNPSVLDFAPTAPTATASKSIYDSPE